MEIKEKVIEWKEEHADELDSAKAVLTGIASGATIGLILGGFYILGYKVREEECYKSIKQCEKIGWLRAYNPETHARISYDELVDIVNH